MTYLLSLRSSRLAVWVGFLQHTNKYLLFNPDIEYFELKIDGGEDAESLYFFFILEGINCL